MIKLIFTGDFNPPEESGNIFSDKLIRVLDDKDFSIVNLEAPITNAKDKIVKAGRNFKLTPEAIKQILKGKFDLVALSNNHIRDFGDQGVIDTIKICHDQGVMTVGAGKNIKEASKPLIVTIKGKRIVFLNYSEKEFSTASTERAGSNPFDLINAFQKISYEKMVNDYVIIIYHGGLEYHYYPTPEIIRRFKFLIDVGADCIISHHTHRYSGMITYKRKTIFFGLGNFISNTNKKVTNEWRTGLIAKIELNDYDEIHYEIIPTKMSKNLKTVDKLSGEENKNVLIHFENLSKQINNFKFIENYWKNVYVESFNSIINLIKSNSLLESKFRKVLLMILKPNISKYKLLNILNIMRCDAHREMVIETLETIYNKGIKDNGKNSV